MCRKRTSGFTLIEVITALALLSIVMAIAIPSMRSLINNEKMKSATFDFVATVMFARSEAVKFGGASTASISIVAPSNNLNSGWCVVFTSSSTCSTSSPGADVMRIGVPIRNVTYQWSTAAGVISFSRTGRLSSTAPVKIQVNDNDGSAQSRCITIDSSGNATTKTGTCS